MLHLYLFVCTYFVCTIILKLFSFKMYIRWKKTISNILQSKRHINNTCCWIIVPVYKETASVTRSYKYFSEIAKESTSNIQIIYVCTKRETDSGTLKILRAQPQNKNVHILNADKNRKFMAGQINFAIEYINKKQNDYKIAIYNVDSRPTLSNIEYNFDMLSSNPVVQQYGDYSNNIPYNSYTIKDFTYLNIFLWQNSWSKLFEIRNTMWNKHLHCLSKFSYVVGHGMFLNKSVLDSVGLLSEKIQNEDMELSIRLHEHNIPICAGIGFSNSDMPLNITDYIKQQSVWARGPLLAFKYANNPRQIIPSIKLFLHFLYWLCEPWFMILMIIIPVIYGSIYMSILSLIISILYFICVLVLPNKSHISQVKKHLIKYIISCFGFFTIHSFGPILSICNILLEKTGLKKEHKFKTPKI